jgi:hypothetical protein
MQLARARYASIWKGDNPSGIWGFFQYVPGGRDNKHMFLAQQQQMRLDNRCCSCWGEHQDMDASGKMLCNAPPLERWRGMKGREIYRASLIAQAVVVRGSPALEGFQVAPWI